MTNIIDFSLHVQVQDLVCYCPYPSLYLKLRGLEPEF